ncbi:MAG: outer membrane lipid asymmetry maintenance protein MlaD [Micavibrio aeruginosavorus]|uniref:Outer membrane lipid asymmetry maintenance protein MlaD n=1 Tax=Micavibrio aeruginosavorus TaxID=349221 RepID=A0A7T5UHK1_9BACT|nr:MAG: outer membrane lipid asymmetry maintenance protein MlaD [Micavibrio aeruginosavorus]
MKRSVIETALGGLVILVALSFLAFSVNTAQVGKVSGYELNARFSGIGGLAVGDDVLISGVKVGSIVAVTLDPETFLANVRMSIENHVKLPADTAALISSESLLGGRYLALEPGAEEDVLKPGSMIEYTQAPQNLEQLLGQFIFSMQGDKDKQPSAGESAADAHP